MPKNSIKQIKQDEKKILAELSKNANKSINDIAETYGFSRQKVWRTVKNLEKNHTIIGYTAIIDEEKLGKKKYILIIKRTTKPITKEILKTMASKELANKIKKIGIDVENSIFTHGNYDWIICFNSPDIRTAKSLVEELNKSYEGFISEIHLLENMFPVINCGVTNPEIKNLKDFFKT